MMTYRLRSVDTLCFIHIPKTGGTSFISLLDAQFHSRDICPSQLWMHLADHPFLSSDYRLIRGHFTYDDYARFVKSPVFISMFRHPIRRFISAYNFMNDYPDVWKHQQTKLDKVYQFNEQAGQAFERSIERYRKAVTLPLDAFVRDPFIQSTMQNLQIRFLTRATTDLSEFDGHALMPLAEQRLHSLPYFGLLEQFDASIALLSYVFGWHPIFQCQKLMVAKSQGYSQGIATATIECLEEINRPDLEFYDMIQSVFNQRFQEMQADLTRRYSSTLPNRQLTSWFSKLLPNWKKTTRAAKQLENPNLTSLSAKQNDSSLSWLDQPTSLSLKKYLDQHYCDRYSDRSFPKQSTIDLKFDQPIDGDGWHLREGNPETDTLIRWMGPGTASTLDLPLSDAQDLVVKIRVVGAIAADVVNSLRLMIGNQSISLSKLYHIDQPGCFLVIYQGTIPKEVIESDRPFTRLTFYINRTQSLHSLDPHNPDRRPIGLAFNWICIFPKVEPSPAEYRMFLFPQNDPCWQDAARFIQKYQDREDKLFAPLEFIEGLAAFEKSYPSNVLPYDTDAEQLIKCDWGIIHKGQIDQIPTVVLTHVRSWNPVFANAVFVILSPNTTLSPLSDEADLKALWNQIADRLKSEPTDPT